MRVSGREGRHGNEAVVSGLTELTSLRVTADYPVCNLRLIVEGEVDCSFVYSNSPAYQLSHGPLAIQLVGERYSPCYDDSPYTRLDQVRSKPTSVNIEELIHLYIILKGEGYVVANSYRVPHERSVASLVTWSVTI